MSDTKRVINLRTDLSTLRSDCSVCDNTECIICPINTNKELILNELEFLVPYEDDTKEGFC